MEFQISTTLASAGTNMTRIVQGEMHSLNMFSNIWPASRGVVTICTRPDKQVFSTFHSQHF